MTWSQPSWIARQIWRGSNYAGRPKGWEKRKKKRRIPWIFDEIPSSIPHPGHKWGGPRPHRSARITQINRGACSSWIMTRTSLQSSAMLSASFTHPPPLPLFIARSMGQIGSMTDWHLLVQVAAPASEVVDDSIVLSQSRNWQNADRQPHES